MRKILVVVDMQNDFVDGSLGTKEAVAIVPAAAEKIRSFDGEEIFVTFDTHGKDYADTLEGQKLPVPHCISGTAGHELNPEILKALEGKAWKEIIKTTFGTFDIVRELTEKYPQEELEFEFIGICTDICVISNVLIARAAFPNAKITVYADCCAGVSKETHEAALTAMECCQIDVVR